MIIIEKRRPDLFFPGRTAVALVVSTGDRKRDEREADKAIYALFRREAERLKPLIDKVAAP